jgi:phage terminase large subunit-like protein
VYVGAGSADQARIIGRMVRQLARHPAIGGRLLVRFDELRIAGETVLLVVSSDASKAFGWPNPSLLVGDECWTWSQREPTMLDAMQSSLAKNPECRALYLTTAAADLDSQLGRMRARAMSGEVTRDGGLIRATAPGLSWIEWSLADDSSPDDMAAVKACNPSPRLTRELLAEQRQRCTEQTFLQQHCCRWGVGMASWLPPGSWMACREDGLQVPAEDPVWLGVDIGGSRSASAVVAVTEDLRVAEVWVGEGTEAALGAAEEVVAIAGRRAVREVAFDPMRFAIEAERLERDHGLTMVQFDQQPSRMTEASENLHRAVVEGKLRHPGHRDLDRHVAQARAKATPRGWRLDKMSRSSQIDAVIALAMAVTRAQAAPEPVRYYGML